MSRFKLFPGMVFGLLGVNVCVVAITVYLATSDRSVAVEPDYYPKALAWDQQARQEARSASLGWTVGLEPGPLQGPQTPVAVTIRDRDGKAIDGASVRLILFHNLRSGERQAVALAGAGEGTYRGTFDGRLAGLWQFRLSATLGGDLFTATVEKDVNPVRNTGT